MTPDTRATLAGIAVIASAALAYVLFGRKPTGTGTAEDSVPSALLEEIITTAKKIGSSIGDTIGAAHGQTAATLAQAYWQLPTAGQPYKAALEYASNQYGLPWPLLARVAYQESRFRQDIITGKVRSSAGAIGIMQIIPQYHPGIAGSGLTAEQAALDPDRAILYAAKYLKQLKNQFGTWQLALAAYNFGPGNVSAGKTWPTETQNYVAQIGKDVVLSA